MAFTHLNRSIEDTRANAPTSREKNFGVWFDYVMGTGTLEGTLDSAVHHTARSEACGSRRLGQFFTCCLAAWSKNDVPSSERVYSPSSVSE